jgi:hypothetical protein
MHYWANEDKVKFSGNIYSWQFMKKLSCNFVSFIPFSTYFRNLLDFLEFLTRKTKTEMGEQYGPNTVGSAQRRNEPRIGPCLRHGTRAHLGGGHRVWFTSGGATVGRDRGNEVWRHRRLQHKDHCGRAPDKVLGAEAHRSGRSTMRWVEAAWRRCPSTTAVLRWPSMVPGGSCSTRPTRERWGATLIRRKRARG